ncbi:DUF3592 domain-containing protein [Micromonospora sp. NPDC049274]|uniref:DUF3592 domain-containing protein n=1 Tax=Micromonospora sp. NPDC049274 TaxID=3154829 RepID=UPI00342E2197
MTRRRPSRTFLRVFSAFYLVLAMTGAALAIWSIAGEQRRSEASAEVLDVEGRGTRTILTVQFSTAHGEACEESFRSSVAANRAVTIGERIRVTYGESHPCRGVREVGDRSPWYIFIIAVVILAAAVIMAYIVWRRPRPPLPLRYAGMP